MAPPLLSTWGGLQEPTEPLEQDESGGATFCLVSCCIMSQSNIQAVVAYIDWQASASSHSPPSQQRKWNRQCGRGGTKYRKRPGNSSSSDSAQWARVEAVQLSVE